MAKKTKSPFPDAAALNASAGIQLPAPFLSLLRLAFQHAGLRGMLYFTDPSLGIFLGGPWQAAFVPKARRTFDIRYRQTPPELVPFARLGADGVHYGFVVRTPEIPSSDYAVGELSPMDGDPVALVGKGFLEAMENLASEHLDMLEDEQPADAAIRRSTCKLLGISPSTRWAERRYTRDGDARPIPVTRARGYKFEPTLDGIGVLAPESAFLSHSTPEADSPAKALAAARAHMKNANHGAALVVLKNAWWNFSFKPEVIAKLAPPMSECYNALLRPAFAAVIERQAAQFGTRR